MEHVNSVVDPDLQGSETFCRIRNFLQDPDPELEVMDPDPAPDLELYLNLTKIHF
jgi:hypothetical protein